MNKTMPKLQRTEDYSIFKMHQCNRNLHDNPSLLASMRAHSFLPSGAIHCRDEGNGKLRVIRGHHRLHYAKQLGIPVYYIVDNTDVNIFNLEGAACQSWSVGDFAVARAKAGDAACKTLLEFKKKHKLAFGIAASLVGGQSAASGNKQKDVRMGTFRVGDMKHAAAVVSVCNAAAEARVSFAKGAAFVAAVSMVLRIPELDATRFMHQVVTSGHVMNKRGTRLEYLEELESLYNRGIHAKHRLPIRFRAIQVGSERQKTFGRKSPKPE